MRRRRKARLLRRLVLGPVAAALAGLRLAPASFVFAFRAARASAAAPA